ncbi:hypothetical protein BH20ACI3_BH20ACI3_22400 [soil metagenome]
MKQAIQEGFILHVLKNYTPVDSYYRLIKKVEDDPEFDIKKAQKKLRRYVESQLHAIAEEAEIMVDHFHQTGTGPDQDWWQGAGNGRYEQCPAGARLFSSFSMRISRNERVRIRLLLPSQANTNMEGRKLPKLRSTASARILSRCAFAKSLIAS